MELEVERWTFFFFELFSFTPLLQVYISIYFHVDQVGRFQTFFQV